MSPEAEIYRGAVIRAVSGRHGAPYTEYDAFALEDICEQLARAERANEILRHRGYGTAGTQVHEAAALVPMKGK